LKIIADTHTHSVACNHAYSTISENAAAAARREMKIMALTEHSPSMPGGPAYIYFLNLRSLPRYLCGVMLLRGIEVNIMDFEGALDLPDAVLDQLEWVIASLHAPNIDPISAKVHTDCWIKIANNPLVDVIGHCGDGRYPFEYKPVIREFARTGKIVEINAHSYLVRSGAKENCRAIALLCAEYGVRVVLNSDAHFCGDVGVFGQAQEMLEEIRFPQELIINADYDRFLAVAREKSGKLLTDEQ